MSYIPLGICREILLRLPAESLIRLRAVCKGWQAVIDDPGFARAHTKKQLSPNTILLRNSTGPPRYPLYFDLEALNNLRNGCQPIPVTPLKLTRAGLLRLPRFPVPSCNGLLLISPFNHENQRRQNIQWDGKESWEIWNPLTHERLKLPRMDFNPSVFGYGIGYDCSADDYKVVVIDYLENRGGCQTNVYSLKSDSWRKNGDCPINYTGYQMDARGAFLNGALHWVERNKIIAFDLETEKYHQMELPFLLTTRTDDILLDTLSGCLVLTLLSCSDYRGYHGWVMNGNGAGYSWMKLFSFYNINKEACRHVRHVAYLKGKKQVVLQHDCGLLWFDVESNSMKTVWVHGLSVDFGIFSQNCVGSLFRLHDSCGSVVGDKRRRTSKEKMKITTLAETKLTFCVRDYVKDSFHRSHDNC